MPGPRGVHKRRDPRVLYRVLVCQADLRERDDEITLITVILRTIARARGEDVKQTTQLSFYNNMARTIDKRVKKLLSVDWQLQRAKEMIDEHLSNEQGRRADLQSMGDLPT